ncbi:hypothetical protein ACPA9J_20590 [Pseudomonas aeruginosa]
MFIGPEPGSSSSTTSEVQVRHLRLDVQIFSSRLPGTPTRRHRGQSNKGHRPGVKGGYFRAPPVDHDHHEIRTAMCNALERNGPEPVDPPPRSGNRRPERDRRRVQHPWSPRPAGVQTLKYCVHNVADAYGKTVTFMPKPLYGIGSSGHARAHVDLQDGETPSPAEAMPACRDRPVLHRRHHQARQALNGFATPRPTPTSALVPG